MRRNQGARGPNLIFSIEMKLQCPPSAEQLPTPLILMEAFLCLVASLSNMIPLPEALDLNLLNHLTFLISVVITQKDGQSRASLFSYRLTNPTYLAGCTVLFVLQ